MATVLSIEELVPRMVQLGVSRNDFQEKVLSYMAFKVPEAEAIKAALKFFSKEKGFEVKDAYKNPEYTISGAIVGFQSGSGLIERCPECNRALYKGQCNEHGKTEGVADLRLKLLVDNGCNVFSVVLGGELTAEITGMTVEHASELALAHLDKSIVIDVMKQKLIGRYITASVTVLGDYYIARTAKADVSELTNAPAPSSQQRRNIAHRISAAVFEASHADSEPIEGFAHDSKFIVTPKGVKVNRVFVVGALLELPEGSVSGTVKARVVDHTGRFLLMAGEFLPESRQKLAEMRAPVYLAVVGKVAWFEAGDGRVVKYIRPEEVAVVDESVHKLWKAEITELV